MMVAFDRWVRQVLSIVSVPIARAFVTVGATPDMLTVIGFVGNVTVAVLIAQGRLAVAGVVLLISGLFDSLDGTAARLMGRKDRSGALLDSVVDRYSEAVVFLGILVYFFEGGHLIGLTLTFLAIIGSLLVSYIRARAEGLNVECRVGLMQRGERIVMLVIGLIGARWETRLWSTPLLGEAPFLVLVLAVLAVLANVTAVHRLIFSYAELQRAHRG
jgi:CDP-diacylglycerol--glycerol-3-phosphate 3-phosphatidyltransferase